MGSITRSAPLLLAGLLFVMTLADIQNNPNALVDAGGVTVFVAGGLMRFVTLILLLVVPLLTRSKMIDLVDRVLVIDAPEAVQLERLMGRDDIDEALARKMIAAQEDRAERLAIAQDVLVNTGPRSDIADLAEEDKLLREETTTTYSADL